MPIVVIEQLIGGTAARIAHSLAKSAWRRLSSGEGTMGPRLHDWAYLELADLDVAQYNSTLTGEWTRGLLIRRNIADGAVAFFSTWCPKGTPAKKLIALLVGSGNPSYLFERGHLCGNRLSFALILPSTFFFVSSDAGAHWRLHVSQHGALFVGLC